MYIFYQTNKEGEVMKKSLVALSIVIVISVVCFSITFAVPIKTIGDENTERFFIESFVDQYPDRGMAQHIYNNVTLGDCLVCYASEMSGMEIPEYLQTKFERLFIGYIIQDVADEIKATETET